MNLTPAALIRLAGIAGILSGVTFIGVQIGHPPLDVTSVDTTEWVVRNTAKMVFAALALTAITGMYLHQTRKMGVLGLLSYLLLGTGYLLIISTGFVAGYVLPSLAQTDPSYVDGVLKTAAGGTAATDIGIIKSALIAEGAAFLIGGFLFAIALFRARVLAPWAAVLLAAGAVSTLALPLLPDNLYRLLAYPNAIALIGLGYSLWRTQRHADAALTATA